MADVTVFGAGVFGLSVAWACLCKGAQVQVIDPGGVAAGASGGIVGALAPHVPENWNDKKAFQLESLLMARDWWAKVAQAGGGDPGYARLGRVQALADSRAVDLAQARAQGADTLWQGQAAWRVTDQPAAIAPASPTGLWVFDDLSARIHPRRACHALAAAISAQGGAVRCEGEAKGAVVLATGVAGLAALGEETGRAEGTGVKGQAALLRLNWPDAPQLFVDGLHIVPHADGTVAIGSTSERGYHDAATTDAQLDALVARARLLVPKLGSAPVIARWAAARPRAASRAPLLGKHPLRERTWIANGGFKIGFGMAPLVGETLADLILNGVDRIPDAFKPRPCPVP